MTTITDKQAAILRRKGIPFDQTTSRNEARGLVKLALKAASPKTRRYLDVLGISYDPFISQDQADAAIRHHESETRRLYSELDDTPDLLFDLANSTTTWARVTSHHAKGFCPFCSGKNFYINRQENIGGCTSCDWNRQGAGPVGFYAQLNGLEWHEATRQLANARPESMKPTITKPATRPKMTIEEFQHKWERRIKYGYGRVGLAQNTTRRYLESRGITYATIQAFGVSADTEGYGPYRDRECILFPYYNNDGQLCAVNRRISAKVRDDKCRFALGSQKRAAFFGVSGFSGLTWVIEGEINAMSAWQALQALGRSDTVLSVSSETDIKARSSEFKNKWGANVIVWCDKQEIADVARGFGLTAWATRQDANDLLMNGKLADCLEWMLNRQK